MKTDVLICIIYFFASQVSAHAAKRKIAETSTTPRDFLRKYDELKSKKLSKHPVNKFLLPYYIK